MRRIKCPNPACPEYFTLKGNFYEHPYVRNSNCPYSAGEKMSGMQLLEKKRKAGNGIEPIAHYTDKEPQSHSE